MIPKSSARARALARARSRALARQQAPLGVISFSFCSVPGKDFHPGKERLRNTSRLGVLRAFLGVNRLYLAR